MATTIRRCGRSSTLTNGEDDKAAAARTTTRKKKKANEQKRGKKKKPPSPPPSPVMLLLLLGAALLVPTPSRAAAFAAVDVDLDRGTTSAAASAIARAGATTITATSSTTSTTGYYNCRYNNYLQRRRRRLGQRRPGTTRTTTTTTELGLASNGDDDDDDRDDDVDKGFNLLELASSGGRLSFLSQGALVKTAKAGWKFAWKRMMSELAPQDRKGNYRRPTYDFNGRRIGDADFVDEPNRYHLYVGNPCPWCHRAVLTAKLLELDESQLGITQLVDDPERASRGGWVFDDGDRKEYADPLFGCRDLRELYDELTIRETGRRYRGRCTAPLLVDKKSKRVVSNESADIVRMLNFAYFGGDDGGKDESSSGRIDLYPQQLRQQIDETNEWTYRLVNNGVYRCGFATSQSAYDAASRDVREGLGRCDALLETSPYLCGARVTEADVRLLPTALRFDGAYAPLFKAGGAHLRLRTDFPNVHAWLRRCWTAYPGIQGSIDIADACSSYYRQLFPLNPGGIVPTPVTAQELGLE